MFSLAEPAANHGSGMQGAFRLYPTPKYERERESEREGHAPPVRQGSISAVFSGVPSAGMNT